MLPKNDWIIQVILQLYCVYKISKTLLLLFFCVLSILHDVLNNNQLNKFNITENSFHYIYVLSFEESYIEMTNLEEIDIHILYIYTLYIIIIIVIIIVIIMIIIVLETATAAAVAFKQFRKKIFTSKFIFAKLYF